MRSGPRTQARQHNQLLHSFLDGTKVTKQPTAAFSIASMLGGMGFEAPPELLKEAEALRVRAQRVRQLATDLNDADRALLILHAEELEALAADLEKESGKATLIGLHLSVRIAQLTSTIDLLVGLYSGSGLS